MFCGMRHICPIAAVCTVVEILNLKCIGSRSWHLVRSSIMWPFDSQYAASYRCSIWHRPVIFNSFWDINLTCPCFHHLDLSAHATTLVMWPFNSLYAISYGCSIGSDTISTRFPAIKAQIFRYKDLHHSGSLTSSVMWPFDLHCAIFLVFYR